jgi:hypothetical protein
MTEPINDNEFVPMRSKTTGVVTNYPRHYLQHPVFGDDLELYTPGEYEEDKVVIEDHELPADQRVQIVAKPLDEFTVAELKGIAAEQDLATNGSKSDLIERISDNATNNEEESK